LEQTLLPYLLDAGGNPSSGEPKKEQNMYENNEEKSNYEGIFARQPDNTESTVWGTVETHAQTFGPDIQVRKDWYGGVQSVEENWFNS
jgi:hypothetical protein